MNRIYIINTEISNNYVRNFEELKLFYNNKHVVKRDMNYLDKYFGNRYAKKIDKSVQLCIYSSENLLNSSRLPTIEHSRTGILLGNNFASWNYVENQMQNLYSSVENPLNPYVATAWFPAAAQGEISIRNKLFGHSKTFSLDQLSSAIAIDYGIDLLKNNSLDYALLGGFEYLNSPIITSALNNMELISDSYPASDGAAVMLVSKDKRHAQDNLGKILCLSRKKNLDTLLTSLSTNFLKQNIDYILLPPTDTSNEKNNYNLENELKLVNAHMNHKSFGLGMPTYIFGELSGASYITQLVTAILMLDKQYIPDGHLSHLGVNKEPSLNTRIKNILVIGRNYYFNDYFGLIVSK